MLLDLQIRSRTLGRKSLLDVMQFMYHQFYQAPAATTTDRAGALRKRISSEALNSVTGSDFAPFFEQYVSGTDSLPYQATLALVGLKLRAVTPADAPPSLGVTVQPESARSENSFDFSRQRRRPGWPEPR